MLQSNGRRVAYIVVNVVRALILGHNS